MWYLPPHGQLVPSVAHFSPPFSRMYALCTRLMLRNHAVGEKRLPLTGNNCFDDAPTVIQQYAVCTAVNSILDKSVLPRRLTGLLDAAAGMPFHFIAKSEIAFDRSDISLLMSELGFDTATPRDPKEKDFKRYWAHVMQPAIDLVTWGSLPSSNPQLALVSVEPTCFHAHPPMPLDVDLIALADNLGQTVEASL